MQLQVDRGEKASGALCFGRFFFIASCSWLLVGLVTTGCVRQVAVVEGSALCGRLLELLLGRVQSIHRTAYFTTADTQHTGVDHRRRQVSVTEQILRRANVVARLQQQLGREGVQ